MFANRYTRVTNSIDTTYLPTTSATSTTSSSDEACYHGDNRDEIITLSSSDEYVDLDETWCKSVDKRFETSGNYIETENVASNPAYMWNDECQESPDDSIFEEKNNETVKKGTQSFENHFNPEFEFRRNPEPVNNQEFIFSQDLSRRNHEEHLKKKFKVKELSIRLERVTLSSHLIFPMLKPINTVQEFSLNDSILLASGISEQSSIGSNISYQKNNETGDLSLDCDNIQAQSNPHCFAETDLDVTHENITEPNKLKDVCEWLNGSSPYNNNCTAVTPSTTDSVIHISDDDSVIATGSSETRTVFSEFITAPELDIPELETKADTSNTKQYTEVQYTSFIRDVSEELNNYSVLSGQEPTSCNIQDSIHIIDRSSDDDCQIIDDFDIIVPMPENVQEAARSEQNGLSTSSWDHKFCGDLNNNSFRHN